MAISNTTTKNILFIVNIICGMQMVRHNALLHLPTTALPASGSMGLISALQNKAPLY
jgi:hypothetical protein